jgi:hypothetical protein
MPTQAFTDLTIGLATLDANADLLTLIQRQIPLATLSFSQHRHSFFDNATPHRVQTHTS